MADNERLQKLQGRQEELRRKNKDLMNLLTEAESDPNNTELLKAAIAETRREMMAKRLGPYGLRALNKLRHKARSQPELKRRETNRLIKELRLTAEQKEEQVGWWGADRNRNPI